MDTKFDYSILPPEPSIEEAMKDPGVTAIVKYTPPNSAAPHTEDDDKRLLDNLDRLTPWMQRIITGVAAELNNA